MQTLRTSIRRKAASTPDLESRAHPYDPHRHAACQHGRRGLGTSQGKSTHQPTSVASTLQRSWQAPAAKSSQRTLQGRHETPGSEAAKHAGGKAQCRPPRSRRARSGEGRWPPAAKTPSTLQRSQQAPYSEVAKHPTAKSRSTLQRSREAPYSEVAKHPAAKSRSTLQRSREAPRSEVAKHPAAKS